MRTITELINESIVSDINEAKTKWNEIDALALYKIWSGNEDPADYGVDPKDLDDLRKHAWMAPSEGGYDGDGRSCFDVLADDGVDEDWLCSLFDTDDIDDAREYADDDSDRFTDVFHFDLSPETMAACKNYVKDVDGKPMKTNPKAGIAYWNSGFDAPMVVLFDVPASHQLVKGLKTVEEFA